MGSWLTSLISPLKNIKIESNCCNKNEISASFTKCIRCHGSGKIYIKSFIEQNIPIQNINVLNKKDEKRNAREINIINESYK